MHLNIKKQGLVITFLEEYKTNHGQIFNISQTKHAEIPESKSVVAVLFELRKSMRLFR